MSRYIFTIRYNDADGKIRNNVVRELKAHSLTAAYEKLKADIEIEGSTNLEVTSCEEKKI